MGRIEILRDGRNGHALGWERNAQGWDGHALGRDGRGILRYGMGEECSEMGGIEMRRGDGG